jgi:hypothetical protein
VWQTTSQVNLLRQTRATLVGLRALFPPDTQPGLTVQQIGDVDTAVLRADPRLWVAYERGWRPVGGIRILAGQKQKIEQSF